MLNLYKKSQEAQAQWIRKNPVKYVAYNAIGLLAIFGYYWIKDTRDARKLDIPAQPEN